MKRYFAALLALLLMLLIAACAGEVEDFDKKKDDEKTPSQTEQATQPEDTGPEETEPEETELIVPPETIPSETEPVATEPESKFPYLETVKFADQPIYSGPGYGHDHVGTVEIAGVYTIVEEAYDEEGHLWGKLKSGAGWIDLTNSRYASGHREEEFITADFTQDDGDQFYMGEASEYQVRIGFTAHKDLEFVFSELEWNAESYTVSRELYSGSMETGESFVAQITFWGDFTTYGMTVTDDDGNTIHYAVYTSGEDGSLMLREYEP